MAYLTEDNGHKSGQRLNLLLAAIGALYLISTVGFYIITRAFKDAGISESEWFGLGAFVTGLFIGLGVNAGVKAYQKKYEEKNTDENSQ